MSGRRRRRQALDLNHDGRTDLCLIYEQSDLLYHFNRGFRTFAAEAEVRIPDAQTNPGEPRVGQRAIAAADFNGRRLLRPGRPANQRGPDLLLQRNDGRARCPLAPGPGNDRSGHRKLLGGRGLLVLLGRGSRAGTFSGRFCQHSRPGRVPDQVSPAWRKASR